MADHEQTPQGAIPPKVTPFAKPDAAPAITPAGTTPRPITIRLKPVVADATQTTDAPQAPAPAITPIVTPPVETAEKVEEKVAPSPVSAIRPATIRLRPVAPPDDANTQIGSAPTIAQPQPPPTPGSHPLPQGSKPQSAAQVQAAKSKTSRISLDSAIGVAPTMTPMNAEKSDPKTIRLKRPADLVPPTSQTKSATTPIRQTSRIPDSALSTTQSDSKDSSSITQKKTLKIKRPSAAQPEGDASSGSSDAFPEGVQLTPISATDFQGPEESNIFTTLAVVAGVAAAVVLLLLTLCLGAHAVGPNAGKNSLASIGGPELPWAGRINN